DVPEFGNTCFASFQLQLFADGTIVFAYSSLPGDQCDGPLHDGLAGISPGGGAADPGEIDLTSALPFHSVSGTVYEFFARTAGAGVDPFDLAPGFYIFVPDGNGGFSVSSSRCGNGRVEPPEECDDHNLSSGDGCASDCRIEPCHSCAGEPSVCSPLP